jgi:hypothetical protein
MHIIREKKTEEILYIDHSPSTSKRNGEEIYKGFNPETMEVGWTKHSYVPAYFDIDRKGKITELTLAEAAKRGLHKLPEDQKIVNGEIEHKSKSELIADGLINISNIKQDALEYYNALSFAKRGELIPDYKLENASLGVYEDKDRLSTYRETIKAFRAEYKRIEALVNSANSVEEIEAIKQNFPEELISARSD